MKSSILIAFIVGLLNIQTAYAAETIAKVSVFSSGKLLLNGKESNLSAIESEFKTLQSNKGVVYYYRENPQMEPPKQGMEVIQLVIKYKLPISMSSKPDFSDYIDENGQSQPRKP